MEALRIGSSFGYFPVKISNKENKKQVGKLTTDRTIFKILMKTN